MRVNGRVRLKDKTPSSPGRTPFCTSIMRISQRRPAVRVHMLANGRDRFSRVKRAGHDARLVPKDRPEYGSVSAPLAVSLSIDAVDCELRSVGCYLYSSKAACVGGNPSASAMRVHSSSNCRIKSSPCAVARIVPMSARIKQVIPARVPRKTSLSHMSC